MTSHVSLQSVSYNRAVDCFSIPLTPNVLSVLERCQFSLSFPSLDNAISTGLYSPDNVKSPTDYYYRGSNGLGHRIQNNEKVLGQADVRFCVSYSEQRMWRG